MNDAEQLILRELAYIRAEIREGLQDCRKEIAKLHEKIDTTTTTVHELDKKVLANKVHLTSFVGVLAFAFSILGTILSTLAKKYIGL